MIAKNFPFILAFTLAFALLVALLPVSVTATPQAEPVINKVYITNVRDNTFVVSWTTDILSNGSVTYGAGLPSTTINDSVVSTTTHYVTVEPVMPNTVYNFYVQSGATIDNNGGTYYQVTTGPTITPPTPGKSVYGYMFETDGVTPVPYGIVYLQLQDVDGLGSTSNSQWFSARTEDPSGGWSFDLVNVRTSNFQQYYSFTDGVDTLRLIGQGGIKGARGVDPNPFVIVTPTLPTPYYYQVSDLILNQDPTAVTLLDLRATNAVPVAVPLAVAVGLLGFLVATRLAWRK